MRRQTGLPKVDFVTIKILARELCNYKNKVFFLDILRLRKTLPNEQKRGHQRGAHTIQERPKDEGLGI